MIFILGGEGYVGQAYARLMVALGKPFAVITRSNYQDFVGKSCELLINANGNSKKFLADRDPVWDFDASVASVVRSIENFKAQRYVLLSSGDVYPEQSCPDVTREDLELDTRRMSRYGLHKRMAETMALSVHPRALVMRMGGFVGPGMKKNAVFDMLNDQKVWLHPDSELQFISTDAAAMLVWSLIDRGVEGEIVNLGATGTVRIGTLHKRIGSRAPYADDPRKVRFELSTEKLRNLSGTDLPSSEGEIETFLRAISR